MITITSLHQQGFFQGPVVNFPLCLVAYFNLLFVLLLWSLSNIAIHFVSSFPIVIHLVNWPLAAMMAFSQTHYCIHVGEQLLYCCQFILGLQIPCLHLLKLLRFSTVN